MWGSFDELLELLFRAFLGYYICVLLLIILAVHVLDIIVFGILRFINVLLDYIDVEWCIEWFIKFVARTILL